MKNLLQIQEATEVVDKLFEYNISLGILGCIVVFEGYIIYRLFNDREKIRTAWLELVKAKEGQVEAKDRLLQEANQSDKALIEKMASLMTKTEMTMERITNKLLN